MSKKKKIALLAAVGLALLVVNGAFVWALLFHNSGPEQSEPIDGPPALTEQELAELSKQQQDNYYRTRFTLSNAVDLCGQKVRSRNSNLLQMHSDDRTNRYKEADGIYLVRFETVTGTSKGYEESYHICEVDPKEQAISYYQEILKKQVFLPAD